jgi:hypothetical protein
MENEKRKEYYEKNKETHRAYYKKYVDNKERVAAIIKKYQSEHKEDYNVAQKNIKKKIKNIINFIINIIDKAMILKILK